MEDGLQVAPLVGIREDKRAQGSSVELAVWRQNVPTKSLDHRLEPWLPRRNHEARRLVRIDHRNAELGESPGDRALAACNAAGEPNSQASTVAAMRNTQTAS
jgi:hypothetical protein